MQPEIRVIRLEGTPADWPLPSYETAGAAGADLCAFLPDDDAEFQPGARGLIPTGLAFEIPPGFEIQVRPRSGLALKQGLMVVNSPGTIDSDYRGEIGVIVLNAGSEPVVISHGMRIAQLVIAPVLQASFKVTGSLSGTLRGAGGFGSTGVK